MRFSVVIASLLAYGATQVACAQSPAHPPAKLKTPIVYRNAEYGFCFSLPSNWKGYTVSKNEWTGWNTRTNERPHGPMITIRNPKWTEENPYQDIPIMIFTPEVWKLVDDGEVSVSAAPYGPGELGRNDRFVFALPPRLLGFDDAIGQDEVAALLRQHPFRAPCGKSTAQPLE